MALSVVKEQVDRFLNTNTPEVMSIKGAWGVGKTYTFNELIKKAKENNKIGLNKYSYVSLFGVSSLEALKYAIFEQSINVELIGEPFRLETIKDNKLASLCSGLKRSIEFTTKVPWLKNITIPLQSIFFSSVRDTIVCIDDFERKSDNLNTQDILGLVSLLKEQRNCKLVLIFNYEYMAETAIYDKFREKVVDFEIDFNPTSKDCIEIALPGEPAYMNEIGLLVERLKINNIRIIKKIERMAVNVYPFVKEFEPEVLLRALQFISLYCYCYYGNNKEVPSCEYIKNLGGELLFGLYADNNQSDEEKKWTAFLRNYGFKYVNNLDLVLIEVIEKGYVQGDLLRAEADKLNKEILAEKSIVDFREAWELYHYDFEKNENEVISAINSSAIRNIKFINLLDLNSTMKLFKELGEEASATRLLEKYFSENSERLSKIKFSRESFFGEITDPNLIEKLTKIEDDQRSKVGIDEILTKIADNESWSAEDTATLASTTSEDYYNLFKRIKGRNLSRCIDVCLRFGRYQGATPEYFKIASTATDALTKIAMESKIGEMRMRRFGIQLKKD